MLAHLVRLPHTRLPLPRTRSAFSHTRLALALALLLAAPTSAFATPRAIEPAQDPASRPSAARAQDPEQDPAQDPSPAADESPAAEAPLDEDVVVYPNWYVGDRYLLALVKARKRVRDGQVELDAESTTEVFVEVLDEDDDGFLISWRFGMPEMPMIPEGTPADAVRFAEQLAELMSGFELRFRTDEFGSFAAVDNVEEVVATLDAALEAMRATMREKLLEEGGAPEVARELDRVFDSLGSWDSMIQAAARDLAPYYMASGLALDLGEPIAYEDAIPNLFGGPPFPARAEWSARRVDAEEQTATLRWTQEIDGERAADVIVETFMGISQRMGQQLDEANLPPLTIKDEAVFEYDLELGLPLEARYTRRVVVADRLSVDELRYSLLEFPAEPPEEFLELGADGAQAAPPASSEEIEEG